MIIIFVGKYLFYYVLILQIINFGLIWFVRYKIEEIWGKNTKKYTRKPKPTKGMPPADQRRDPHATWPNPRAQTCAASAARSLPSPTRQEARFSPTSSAHGARSCHLQRAQVRVFQQPDTWAPRRSSPPIRVEFSAPGGPQLSPNSVNFSKPSPNRGLPRVRSTSKQRISL